MSEHWIYGVHAVQALLTNPYRKINALYVNQERTDSKITALVEKATNLNLPVNLLSSKAMNLRFSEFNHQGLVASAGPLPKLSESSIKDLIDACQKPAFILILDGITDPHNLGACLRSADAAGVDFVVAPKDNSAPITPVVSKVACGAVESVPFVVVTNLVRAIECIKNEGVFVYGAAGEADNTLYQVDCKGPTALVMGAEGKGLRRLTREHCDGLFSLPMQGTVDSLNVSVAAGVSLYEVVRQRGCA